MAYRSKLSVQFFFASAFVGAYLSLLLESPKRRGEMTLATTQQAVSVAFNMLAKRGYIKPLEHGDVLVFAGSMSTLLYFYKHDPKVLGNIQGIFHTLIGKDDEKPHWIDSQLSQWRPKISQSPMGKIIFVTVIGFIKSFLIGFFIKTLFRVVGGPNIIRNPGKFLRDSLALHNNRFPLFLGTLASTTRLLTTTFKEISGKDHPLATLAIGFLSGMSILLARSTEVSMWFASKAGEAVVRSAIDKGFFKPPPNGQTLLYSFATATIFYNIVYEKYNLRPSAWKFLLNVTGGPNGLLGHFPKLGDSLRKDIGLEK